MRGSIVHRGKNRWALVLDLGYVTDPTTGTHKRKQKWIAFRGTKKEAGEKLTELVRDSNRGELVEPTKLTVQKWLEEWLEKAVRPTRRARTYTTYKHVIGHNLIPAFGHLKLQALKPLDIQQYYADHSRLSAATVRQHHAVLSAALRSAVRQGLVTRNVATLTDGLPRIERTADDVAATCWTVSEAKTFLEAAKAAGARAAAFYGLALDSGARLGELCGLKWIDIDLDAGKVAIVRQLLSAQLGEDRSPQFGPTKTGRSRAVDISAETVSLLRAHKAHQATIKMANRMTYLDAGLVFAKEAPDLFQATDTLGAPIQVHNINTGEFGRLIKKADVRRITFHGLRHTSATLLLLAGVSAKVVSERLGHSKIAITLDTYSHVLPSMGQAAAAQIGALLHG